MMDHEPLSPSLRVLVEAERARPDPPPDTKALARAKLATLLGPDAGLGGAGSGGSARDLGNGGTGGDGGTGPDGARGPKTTRLDAGASGLGAAKLIGALLVGGVIGGGVATGIMRPAERVVYVDRAPPASSPSGAASSPPAVTAADVSSSRPTVSAAPRATRAAPPTTATTATSSASSARPHDGDLSRERAILERARAALARGDAAAALAAVAQHERAFAKGQLTEEREVVAVQALVTAGRTQEAAERGASFRKAFPNSVLLPIVDQALR